MNNNFEEKYKIFLENFEKLKKNIENKKNDKNIDYILDSYNNILENKLNEISDNGIENVDLFVNSCFSKSELKHYNNFIKDFMPYIILYNLHNKVS